MALDAYVKIDGIAGESKDSGHEEWIEITSYNFGNSQSTTVTASSAGGAASGRTKLTDFHITKELDRASPKLLGASCAGQHIKQVTIAVHRAGGDKVKYFEVVLEEVIIRTSRKSPTTAFRLNRLISITDVSLLPTCNKIVPMERAEAA
jgi:type VI secretion system Hcp family effector